MLKLSLILADGKLKKSRRKVHWDGWAGACGPSSVLQCEHLCQGGDGQRSAGVTLGEVVKNTDGSKSCDCRSAAKIIWVMRTAHNSIFSVLL